MRIVEGGRKNFFLCRMLARPSSQVIVAQEEGCGLVGRQGCGEQFFVGPFLLNGPLFWASMAQSTDQVLGRKSRQCSGFLLEEGTSLSTTEIKPYVYVCQKLQLLQRRTHTVRTRRVKMRRIDSPKVTGWDESDHSQSNGSRRLKSFRNFYHVNPRNLIAIHVQSLLRQSRVPNDFVKFSSKACAGSHPHHQCPTKPHVALLLNCVFLSRVTGTAMQTGIPVHINLMGRADFAFQSRL